MSNPSTQVIALWVQESLIEENWISLREIGARALSQRWAKPTVLIEDYIEEHLTHLGEALRDELAERLVDGKVRDFEIDDELPPYIRRLHSRRPDLLEKLRKLNPFDFEGVCSKILEQLGAVAEVTQRTNDGGIDFIGREMKILHAELPMPVSCNAIVIGQAKRFREGSAISETRLREFVGASVLQRHRMSVKNQIPPLAPILFAFWTTSDLEPNAKKYARSVGLWYMDGVTLAAYVKELSLSDYVDEMLKSFQQSLQSS